MFTDDQPVVLEQLRLEFLVLLLGQILQCVGRRDELRCKIVRRALRHRKHDEVHDRAHRDNREQQQRCRNRDRGTAEQR